MRTEYTHLAALQLVVTKDEEEDTRLCPGLLVGRRLHGGHPLCVSRSGTSSCNS